MAGQSDRSLLSLAITGSPGKLQVALEHLRNTVHSPVSQRPTAGQHRQTARTIAIDTAILDETVGFSLRAQTQRLEPEINERRESIVELGEVDVSRSEARAIPQTTGRLSSNPHDVVERPVQGQPCRRRGTSRIAGHIDRPVRHLAGPDLPR